ncbi:MAG: AraC family transcriptional regulator N-terminal domain-containing protein, partial [bacterium]|nr:AraC family transcriptional regulator N-terminal domain-containing protein [bacterium]
MTQPVPPGVYGELAKIVTRYATGGPEPASPREGLYFTRRDEPSQPLHVAQRPSFWLVVQGRKCLSIGDDDLHYGVGD